MPLPKNILDDKQFKDFMEEAKAKLPALSPEWTDYNISDPGITLLEILAWLQDINIYKLSRITDKHILKYLQLLDSLPEPVKPASTFVVFKSNELKPVPKDKDLKAKFLGKTINFKTTQKVNIQTAEIKKLIFSNERGLTQYELTENSSVPEYFYLFGEEARKNSIFYIGFDKPLKDSFTIGIKLFEDDLPPIGTHNKEYFKFIPDVEIEWSYWNGTDWEITKPEKDNTRKFYKSGTIIFDISEKSEMKPKKIPVNSEKEYYFLKCKLTKAGYEISPKVRQFLLNAVEVVQKEINGEYLGGSSGFPYQEFKLSKKPLTEDKVIVEINGEKWEETVDLSHHSHKEKVFKVDRTEGKIFFGDNINGKVPPAGSTITVTYFTSKGKDGNINSLTDWETGIEDVFALNPFPAENGKNPESFEETFIKIKKDLTTPYQCVTFEDFEYVAVQTPDLRVARAKAYQVDDKNLVNIIVVPFSFQRKPFPSKNFLKAVCLHIDKHRLITTDINVLPPEYAEISTSASIKIKEDFNSEQVLKKAQDRLKQFFHPIFGWKDGKGWDFGHPVYLSDVYEQIESVEGVDCIFNLQLIPKGAFIKKENGNVILKPYALTISGSHKLSVVQSAEECRS